MDKTSIVQRSHLSLRLSLPGANLFLQLRVFEGPYRLLPSVLDAAALLNLGAHSLFCNGKRSNGHPKVFFFFLFLVFVPFPQFPFPSFSVGDRHSVHPIVYRPELGSVVSDIYLSLVAVVNQNTYIIIKCFIRHQC